MGLDGVELIMTAEEEFGITITDSEAEEVVTVGDLAVICQQRIDGTVTRDDQLRTSFYMLRELVREIRNEPTLRIRPSAQVSAFLEPAECKSLWNQTARQFGLTYPLRRPPWLSTTLLMLSFAFPIILLSLFSWQPFVLMLVVAATLGFIGIIYTITQPFRSYPPSGSATFKEIATRLAGLHIATKPPADIAPDAVFASIKKIVAEQFQVPESEITSSTRFVEDLGMS